MLNRLFSEIRFRVRALFRRDRLEQELDTDLSFHLQKEAEKHMATGVSPEEARRRARAAFGAVQGRSEEHTSELQSPCNLVCRLLLETKKKKEISDRHR